MNNIYTFNKDSLSFNDSTKSVKRYMDKMSGLFFAIGLLIGLLVVAISCFSYKQSIKNTELMVSEKIKIINDLQNKQDSLIKVNRKLSKINKIRYDNSPTKKEIKEFLDTGITIVPKHIVKAILEVETTNYNINAVSPTGCKGLAQLCKRTQKEMSGHPELKGLNSWQKNVKMGMLYLHKQYKRYGSWSMAINYYNHGHPNKRAYNDKFWTTLSLYKKLNK